MLVLNPVVRAIVAAAVAVIGTISAGVAANTPPALLAIYALGALVSTFIATYSVASTAAKLLAAAVIAALGSLASSYTGNADVTQAILLAALAFAGGLGFTAAVKNTPAIAAAKVQ